MNKLAAALLVISGVVGLGLSACSKQEAPATTTAANTTAPAPAEAPAPAPAPAATATDDAAADAAAAVTEAVSETGDAPVTAAPETINPGTQPMLRLGGPSNASPTSAKFKEGTNYNKL